MDRYLFLGWVKYLALKNKVKKYIQTEWPLGSRVGMSGHSRAHLDRCSGGHFQGQHASCLTSALVVVMDMKAHSYFDASILNAFGVEGCPIQQAAWHRYWQWEDNRCKQLVQLARLPGHAGRVGTCFYLLPVTEAPSPRLPPPPNRHHLHLLLR